MKRLGIIVALVTYVIQAYPVEAGKGDALIHYNLGLVAESKGDMDEAYKRYKKACMASDRKARSRERCGCIQAVANDTLSASDQRLAVTFYGDPHKAQEIRQSDNAGHERFWKTYKAYAQSAAAVCG